MLDLAQGQEPALKLLANDSSVRDVLQRIPNEILSKILLAVLEEAPLAEFVYPPWYLGHVCQHWRALALALPGLWSVIAHGRSSEKIKTLIERSGAEPLRVRFWMPYGGGRERQEQALAVLDMLMDVSERWIAVSMDMRPSLVHRLSVLRGRLPQLRFLGLSLSAATDYSGDGVDYRDTVNAFELAPRLCDVSLDNIAGIRHPNPIALPWGQLTRLHLAIHRPQHLLLLQSTPGLEWASVDFQTEAEAILSTVQIDVELPALRRMFTREIIFFDVLNAPLLEEVYTIDTGPTPLVQFLERSQAQTHKFRTLRLAWATTRSVSAILAAAPQIVSLGLQCGSDKEAEAMVSQLTVRANSTQCLGPNVTDLTLVFDERSVRQGSLMRMIKSRATSDGAKCRKLGVIKIWVTAGSMTLNEQSMYQLKVLQETQGLVYEVKRGPHLIDEWQE
ncbi:unnamed protein product [Mycena citricolor]|uniref:F-box domain-containing protein n=1 Tax=Mycena citricolor TaxID=2018698 RepID=A0AAD2K6B9_9AGAR|nr:unnamed protein product [Mycena citricolor]CAK5279671.1 unnamed protein product [Mycena citricolor]